MVIKAKSKAKVFTSQRVGMVEELIVGLAATMRNPWVYNTGEN